MKFNLIQQAPIWAIRLLSTIVLLLSVINPLQAANTVASNETQPAVGRMPILLNAPNLPVGPIETGATVPVSDIAIVGIPLTLADMGIDWSTYITTSFRDDDGDIEDGTLYEWLIDGSVVSSISTFTPQVEHGGQLLSLRLTPKTKNGDPHIGRSVSTNTILVRSGLIEKFKKPDSSARIWNQAKDYCEGNGYRLPSTSELQQLFLETTKQIVVGVASNDICNRYGWPLQAMCNGSTGRYWTSEADGVGAHWGVDLAGGLIASAPDGAARHVACIK
ncbi:hypothetical protein [Shewanella xiamenensis]|uniref:hypothetical protein n=1 Tax=Shewanella xiamenensis TaxID=332186 RepID=UPI0035B87A2A